MALVAGPLAWDTLDPSAHRAAIVAAARAGWSERAAQERGSHAAMLELAVRFREARAPDDLAAAARRFAGEEAGHADLCARVADRFGGDDARAARPAPPPDPALSPLLAAAEAVVGGLCIGEAVSAPLLAATARAARHPVVRAVLEAIARDEAHHAALGRRALTWLAPLLDDAGRAHLARVAAAAVAPLERLAAAKPPPVDRATAASLHALGSLAPAVWCEHLRRALQRSVAALRLSR